MAGKVLDITNFIEPDRIGTQIARQFVEWNILRQSKIADWDELRKYIYATDTRKTTNSKLPWKNTTTIPKLCQIRDNLFSNYIATLFPKRKSIIWDAEDQSSNTKEKREAVTAYMSYCMGQKNFKNEINKLVLDYIDYGNAFAMVDWVDDRVELKDQDKMQVGYVGPAVKRICPLDIVFNPIADSFESSPKIVRSIVTIGEVRDMLDKLSTPDTAEANEELFNYLMKIRGMASGFSGELAIKDNFYSIDGFASYQKYLGSNYCEILTFYGDLYDRQEDKFLKNQIIIVVDRHKVLYQEANPSYFGKPNIYHVGWRKRQDNLWAMGPLDNLIGMQYRVDHIENLKADVFDLITFPPIKIKGMVDDFDWGPFARIYTSEDGDVEMMAPPFNVTTANGEIQYYLQLMEEMAGSPKEAMGFRTPGEKTKYEVQRLENAAARIFQNKVSQFEEHFVEPILNGMLEQAKRKASGSILVSVLDDEFKINTFLSLTPEDITGQGRIRPYAARHFAEQAETLQNLSQFYQSGLGQDPDIRQHISAIKVSKFLFDDLLDLGDYQLVQPYVRLAEQADAQRQANVLQEQVHTEAATASGINDDYDMEPGDEMAQMAAGPPQGGQQTQPPQAPQAGKRR